MNCEGNANDWPLAAFNDALNAQSLKREWEEWIRAFDLVAEAKNIETQRDKFVTLLARGGRALQNIYFNKAPVAAEITEVRCPRVEIPEYDNAIERLNDYFVGKTNPRIELEIFRSIKQDGAENFNKFLIKLKSQAKHCNFGMREEDEILHQITMGARSEKVRDKGLETSMTLDQLTQYAIGREVLEAQKDGNKQTFFSGAKEVASLSYNQARGVKPGRAGGRYQPYDKRERNERYQTYDKRDKKCFRCGSDAHWGNDTRCPAQQSSCDGCGRKGHFKKVCRTTGQQRQSGKDDKPTINQVRQGDQWEDNDWKSGLPDDVPQV